MLGADISTLQSSSGGESSCIDIGRLEATPLVTEPFDYVIVPHFVRSAALTGINTDFPKIDGGGSFPVCALRFGPAFARLISELEGPDLRRAVERKLGIDLAERPTMVTVRGFSRAKDGRVHTDSKSKLVTALLYLNPAWEAGGGRLRLLRSPDDLDNYAAEVPPEEGTLLIFRCASNAFHGHLPFVGERRSIQLNWVTDEAVMRRELSRHGLTARVKNLFRIFRV